MIDQAFNDLMELPQQILEKIDVNPTTGCWEWNAFRLHGYARICYKNRAQIAHRLIYKLIVKEPAEGHDLHHLCRNKGCVNPRHLTELRRKQHFAQEDHSTKGIREREKTHCPKGHPYSGSNLYIHRGKRKCKQCGLDNNRKPERKAKRHEWYLKRKGALQI